MVGPTAREVDAVDRGVALGGLEATAVVGGPAPQRGLGVDAGRARHDDRRRQHLRQLVRNAHDERKRNKPPRAYRELFRELRDLTAHGDPGAEDPADETLDQDGDDDHG